ncbi:MAG: NCS2 family permease [Sarcina sp.]
MDKFLKRFGENVNVKTEFVAGLTSFLAMAYIIAVNPSILGATGMDQGALVTATCLSAAFGCMIMGFYANLPFGLAAGMGLNAFFAFSVVLGKGITWEVALTAVFVEGIIFILLSLFKVREAAVNSIPLNLKYAVTGGIGIFIAFIGFTGAGMVIKDDATLVKLGTFFSPTVLIAVVGLVTIAILEKKKVKGALLIGIVVSTLIAWGYALFNTQAAATMGIYLPEGIFKFESIAPIAGKLDFSFMNSMEGILNFVIIVFTFLFVDFFDTLGTLIGVSSRSNMLDKDGNVPHAGKALMADAIATTAGALMGTSTVTTYVESAAGVEQGGRTGLTSIFIGLFFAVAMFFSPIFIAIPKCATAPVLIYVGYLMMSNITKIDFNDITEGLPAFLIIVLMPLTYSIGDGLTIGILVYVMVNVLSNIFSKEKKKISIAMIILAIVFTVKLALPMIEKILIG